MAAFIFDTASPIIDAFEAVFPSQHDAHVRKFRSFTAAYGDMEGYRQHVAAKAERMARMRASTDTATIAFLARLDASHRAWREGR